MSAQDRQFGILRGFRRGCYVVGIPLLVVGTVLLGQTALFVMRSERTTAKVTNVEEQISRSKGRSTRVYRPTFEFIDVQGNSRTATLGHFASGYDYSVGRNVEIFYIPENPSKVRVASFLGVWGIALVVSGLGLGGCVFGLLTGRAANNLQKKLDLYAKSS